MVQMQQTQSTTALPPLPEQPDDATLANWLRAVIPLMDEKSRYRRNLARALARYDFRELRANKQRKG